MIKNNVDLHIHSSLSDGKYAPTEIVNIMKDYVDCLAITDHDTIDAIKEAKKECDKYGIEFVNGIEIIGEINLRIGYSGYGPDESSLYYGGQIGYGINEKQRGNSYAVRACRLLFPVAKAHGMTKLLVTNNVTNTASRRVCEKLGARFLRVARLPEWIDLYKEGQRFSNIFEWSVE